MYSTEEIAEAIGKPLPTLNSWIYRGHLEPEAGRVGTGRDLCFSERGALQPALFAVVTAAGGTLRSAKLAWMLLSDEPNPERFGLWIAHAPGQGVTLVPSGAAGPTETHRFVVDVRVLLRDLTTRLRQIAARHTVREPTEYPQRRLFQSPRPGAPMRVLLVDGPSEPDFEAIAAVTDAIENLEHVLVAARCLAGLEAGAGLIDRLLRAAEQPATIH